MPHKPRLLLNTLLRIAQKVPGVNMVEYLVVGDLCYVVNAKAASRSFVHALIKAETGQAGHDDAFYWSRVHIAPYWLFRRRARGLTVFTAIRDPVERLRSCWNEKLQIPGRQGRIRNQYFVLYWPLLRFGMDFLSFVRAVTLIPDALAEKHFMTQCRLLRVGRIPYARIFRLDRMDQAEDWLRTSLPRIDLGLTLNRRSIRPVPLDAALEAKILAHYRRDRDLLDTLGRSGPSAAG